MTAGHVRVEDAIRAANREDRSAIVAFLTAGYPSPDVFPSILQRVADVADVVEIGIPFSDPMADGVTIQRASEQALAHGISLDHAFGMVEPITSAAPVLFMSYLNPVLSMGYGAFADRCEASGVCGVIVPDLPMEERDPLAQQMDRHDLATVPLVSPATSPDRMERITSRARGFVYAVTVAGVTGGEVSNASGAADYLQRVRETAPVPVCAGFGIRTAKDAARLAPCADGLVIGSALIEIIERQEDPVAFLAELRNAAHGIS